MRAHVSLEWDDNQKRVVAKREQIGITWRDLGPFINFFTDRCKVLADALSIPQEIFEMGDVSGVLSYEVWESHLSETEKNLLTQFLPKGTDAEQVVQLLLMGENFHFGNPFVKWGASLCSGHLHPDAVLHQEQCFKASKKAYYLELQEYHNGVVENLQQLKEKWASCKNPEKDNVEKIWSSSRKNVSNSLSSHANETRPRVSEGNLAATSESCSLVADENLCSSSKQKTLMKESGVLKERRGFVDRCRVSSVVSSFKGDPHKPCIRSSDSATYMSYLKITRKQLQLVKRIKQSGDGIKSKSLNCILGDINRFQVHPYKILEEEERKKLHEQWLQLASRDLPSNFSYWTERQLQRQQWRRSLEQEMAQKKFFVLDKDEGKGNPDSSLEDQINNGVTYYEIGVVMQTSVDEEESAQHIINSRPFQRIPSLNSQQELKSIVRELQEGSRDIFKPEGASPMLSKFFGNMNPMEELEIPVHSAKESVPYSTNSRFLQQIPSLSGHHELDPMVELDDGSQHILKPEGAVPKFFGNTNPTNGYVEWEGLVPSAKDAWLEVGTTNSYFHPTSETTASELSLGQSQPIREQPAHLIDLETDMVDQDAEEALLNRPSNNLVSAFRNDTCSSFYSPYTNQDCNEFLQPFLKVHGMLPSQTHRHKQLGSQYLSTNNGSRSDHHPGHFQEQQQQLLEQRQHISARDFFMHQVTHKNVYSSGGRYPHPNQEIFSPVGMQNLSANPVLVQVAPLQAYSNLLGQNCFPDQHQACGGSSEVDASSILGQCLGNRSNADKSLYNVLSQFSTKLQSRSSYNSTRVAEQDVAARQFFSDGNPDDSGVFPHIGHQLNNYLSRREDVDAAVLKANNMLWMNLPHQNSSLNDLSGKPFLRSWNQ